MLDIVAIAAVLVVSVAGTILLIWFTRRHAVGWQIGQRPIEAFQALLAQSDKAVESGRGIHMSLGRADLGGQGNPASIAALEALDVMAKAGARSDTAPLTTVGDGALLLAAQDSLRAAHAGAGRAQLYKPEMAHFIAGRDFAMSYAAGVSDSLHQGKLGSNILLGRFGSEIAIMAEAGQRLGLEQVIGSDDPQAMAIGLAVTDKALIGEELFAAGAYLQPKPAFLASLQLQDVLRVAVVVIMLLAALLDFIL
jgi:hypothetical protein